jgi:hypothetical protein
MWTKLPTALASVTSSRSVASESSFGLKSPKSSGTACLPDSVVAVAALAAGKIAISVATRSSPRTHATIAITTTSRAVA